MKILRDTCPTCETTCDVELTHWFEIPDPPNWPCPNCGTLLRVSESQPVTSTVLSAIAYFTIFAFMDHDSTLALSFCFIGIMAITWIIGKLWGKPRFRAVTKIKDFVEDELERTPSGGYDSKS